MLTVKGTGSASAGIRGNKRCDCYRTMVQRFAQRRAKILASKVRKQVQIVKAGLKGQPFILKAGPVDGLISASFVTET